ncbi:MAG: histidinol-phosphate transaminase [Alistipes sp.]|nr:histidinol-phosphate transaminase [Alistipes sp.]MBQ5618915.1 histidinol-phosphate transaminase [Alistipes sp.]MBQ5923419.1 histidinol-phosphate transaminase [Alistipes sp.]
MKDISRYVRRAIAALTPYSTARDEYEGELGVFLDANESPYENGYNRYPDPHQKALKAQIAAIKGVPAENIFIGNGSDEAIDLVFRVFCEPREDNVVAIAPSYGMYKVAAAINDVEIREVALGEDFSLPTDALLAAADEKTKALFLCSPNNPTANSFPREELMRLVEEFDGMVVVDEAYIDFAEAKSLVGEIASHPNLVVLQTMSKAWGMAGLRVGLALADSRVVGLMSQVKYPYNINVATMKIVSDLLTKGVSEEVEQIKQQRAVVAEALAEFKFVERVYPSDANFLLVRVADADALYEHLIVNGIIVRNRTRVKGCEGCLRITIGLKEENEKLIKSLERYETCNIR